MQEREQDIKDHDMMLEKQLKDQKAFLEEGFTNKAEEINAEIERLEHNIKDKKENIGPILELIEKAFCAGVFSSLIMVALLTHNPSLLRK